MHYKKNLFYLLFLLPIFTLSSQENQSQKVYHNWFDQQVGIENTGLFNGFRYREKYRVIDGNHKFFISSEFKKGTLKYDGQTYYDVSMKYDIFEDQIIVKLTTDSGESILQLIDEKVEGFNLYNKEFVRISDKYAIENNKPGFYINLFQGQNLDLYKKHKKTSKRNIKSDFVYYKFNDEIEYYILFKNEFYLIESKKDLVKILPEFKREIKDYYKKNNPMKSLNYDKFLIELSEKINSNISISNK